MGSIRIPAVRTREPLVLTPGGASIPWPPEDDRLSDGTKRALSFAQDEAAQLNHNHLGPAHLLVGLAHDEHESAAQILAQHGIGLAQLRRALVATMGRSDASIDPAQITLIPRARRVIDMAMGEARRSGRDVTGTDHLLLALVRESETFTMQVLEMLGVNSADIATTVLEQSGGD